MSPATATRSALDPEVAEFLSWVHGILRMRGEHEVAAGLLADLAVGSDDQDRLRRLLARFEARQRAYDDEVARRGETLGQSIWRHMRERGLDTSVVAARIGCHPVHLTDYMFGTRGPSRSEIDRLCKAFGVSTSELVGDVPLPNIGNLNDEVAAFARERS